MTSAHANKSRQRYFYYVSTALTTRKVPGTLPRVSAPRLEAAIAERVSPLLNKHWLAAAPGGAFDAIHRVELGAKSVIVELDASCVADAEISEQPARFEFAHDLARPTMRRRILHAQQTPASRVDRALVRAVIQARRWHDLLAVGEADSIEALAKRESACPIYMGQLLPLACLAPDLVEAILDGRQPERLSLVGLIKANLPLLGRTAGALRTLPLSGSRSTARLVLGANPHSVASEMPRHIQNARREGRVRRRLSAPSRRQANCEPVSGV